MHWPLFNYLWYLVDASKSGVAQETLQNAVRRSSKVMTEQEARQILNVSETTTWEEVMKVNTFHIYILFTVSYMHFERLLKILS